MFYSLLTEHSFVKLEVARISAYLVSILYLLVVLLGKDNCG